MRHPIVFMYHYGNFTAIQRTCEETTVLIFFSKICFVKRFNSITFPLNDMFSKFKMCFLNVSIQQKEILNKMEKLCVYCTNV